MADFLHIYGYKDNAFVCGNAITDKPKISSNKISKIFFH